MKSAMGWIIVLALVVGGAGFGLYQFNITTQEQMYDLALAEIKRDFLVESVGLRQLKAEDYQKEVGIALTKYFERIAKLAKEHPDFYNIERELEFGEAEFERGRMPEGQKLLREERIAITLDLFKRMRQGQYRPLFTAADKTFRFDIYDITPAKVSGENRIKMSYSHWGAFGPIDFGTIIGNMRVEKEKGKPAAIPQMVAEGQPPSLQIKSPERWVKEFPPGMQVGYYDLPQFPREADAVELSFDFTIRTVGGTPLAVNTTFEDIPIPEAWKVPEGQTWEAQERLASDEELRAAGATIENDVGAMQKINAGGAEITVTK